MSEEESKSKTLRFWELGPSKERKKGKKKKGSGRPLYYKKESELWEDACEYFEWVEDNPLQEEKIVGSKDGPVSVMLSKKRPMTVKGLCLFLGMSEDTFGNYCKRDKFLGITKTIKDVIYTQKFTGACAGLFNANIIARELGLAEKSVVDNSHSFENSLDSLR